MGVIHYKGSYINPNTQLEFSKNTIFNTCLKYFRFAFEGMKPSFLSEHLSYGIMVYRKFCFITSTKQMSFNEIVIRSKLLEKINLAKPDTFFNNNK